MPIIQSYTHLECWKQSRLLVQLILRNTKAIEEARQFGLLNQLERATLSIMNNIAEGFGRFSSKEKLRFFNISVASANEVESMTFVLEDLGIYSQSFLTDLRELIHKTRALTLAFCKYLHSKVDK